MAFSCTLGPSGEGGQSVSALWKKERPSGLRRKEQDKPLGTAWGLSSSSTHITCKLHHLEALNGDLLDPKKPDLEVFAVNSQSLSVFVSGIWVALYSPFLKLFFRINLCICFWAHFQSIKAIPFHLWLCFIPVLTGHFFEDTAWYNQNH